jgi:hypothetical protein
MDGERCEIQNQIEPPRISKRIREEEDFTTDFTDCTDGKEEEI